MSRIEELNAPGTMNEKHARAFLARGGPISDEARLAKYFDFIQDVTARRIADWFQRKDPKDETQRETARAIRRGDWKTRR